MNDHVPFVGAGGALASVSLGQWNEIVGIAVGCITGVYVTIKLIMLLKEYRNGKEEKE